MRKLAIMAVCAIASAVTFASNCAPTPVKDTEWTYSWKFNGKTTAGKKGIPVAKASPCAPGSVASCTFRSKASLKIQGYTLYCNPGCGADAFEEFAEALEVFYMTKPWKASIAGGVDTRLSHIIGKNKKQYECAGLARFTENAEGVVYDLVYAGLGKYDLKHSRVKSASGNFAGVASQAWAYNLKNGVCVKAGYWDCETLELVCEAPTVAYGKWSVKYKKSSKSAKTPSWVEKLNS